MSRLVVLEWDHEKLRVIDGKSTKDIAVGHQALSADLSEGSAEISPAEQISNTISSMKLGRADAIVSVDRSAIEMRSLNVPNVPEDELPDVVRFQAMRQFSSLTEEWKLDYIEQHRTEDHGIDVLAAALSPQLFVQIKKCLDGTGLVLRKIVVKPFATAALVSSYVAKDDCVLAVDCSGSEADITVIHEHFVRTTRSVRLPNPENAGAYGQALGREIQRTIATNTNQSNSQAISRVVIFGQIESSVIEGLTDRLAVQIEQVNPFEIGQVTKRLKKRPPEHEWLYSNLIGAMQNISPDAPDQLDFANPRKKKETKLIGERFWLYAGLAALVLVGLTVAALLPLYSLSSKITALRTQVENETPNNEKMLDRVQEIEMIDQWNGVSVNWLDEMYYISDKLPSPDDVRLKNLNMSKLARDDFGSISFKVEGKGAEMASVVEKQLRNDDHKIEGRSNRAILDNELYDHEFDKQLRVSLKNWELTDVIPIVMEKIDAMEKAKAEKQDEDASPDADENDKKAVEKGEDE